MNTISTVMRNFINSSVPLTNLIISSIIIVLYNNSNTIIKVRYIKVKTISIDIESFTITFPTFVLTFIIPSYPLMMCCRDFFIIVPIILIGTMVINHTEKRIANVISFVIDILPSILHPVFFVPLIPSVIYIGYLFLFVH